MDKKFARELGHSLVNREFEKIRKLNEKMKIAQEKLARLRSRLNETNRLLDDLIVQMEKENKRAHE